MPDQNDLFSQPAQVSQPSTQAPESLSDALNEAEEDNMESISGLSEQQIRESVAQQVEQARRNSASSQASDGTGAASDSVSGSEGSEDATDSEAPAGTGLSEFLSSEEAESAQAGAHGAGDGAAAGSASGAASGTSGVAGHRTAMGSAASVATATAGAAAAGAAAASGRSRSAVDQPEIVSNRRKPRRVRVPKARRMRLSIVKFDPWSVAKVSFMLGIANGIIQVVCATILWWMLDAIGVFDKVSSLVNSTGLTGKTGFNVSAILSMGQVVSAVTIFAIFELVLIVIIAVVCAFLYNVVSSLVGGLHVVLGDD
ncbi:DUF3566 domain-containing protein [Aeriscardovia aeriphila]|uniref:DUF3566 domain-containing protein n=1 Tax=Aeriscardovia aeriphila TaxID=218139 RepID=A0A261F7R8_9BIFI|nr:DUF3566 domain-containing protein [Aeriscardovia aeriphila]NYI25077.1 hypothetical protein [Aeriscardovia aeriphila]OZG55134.1 hypothetical protein AEAE_1256 [Aeriscardovia aeriphila]